MIWLPPLGPAKGPLRVSPATISTWSGETPRISAATSTKELLEPDTSTEPTWTRMVPSVSTRQTAAAALDLLSRQTVDLLIADIAMPHMDGYELMRRARTSGFQVPGIAVTAFARSDDRRLAFDAGYTSYLVKPVDGVQLARTVDELLQMRRPG